MTESHEMSVQFLSTTGLMTPAFLTMADGRQFVVISTEIAVRVDELASMLVLIDAKHVTLKAMPSL